MNRVKYVIFETLKTSKKDIFHILFFNILVALTSILQPLFFKQLFDDVLPKKDVGEAIKLILVIVTLPIIYAIFNSFVVYYNNNLGNKLSKDIRVRLFSHLLEVKAGLIDKIERGEIINRLTSQVGVLCEVFIVNTIMSTITNVIMLIGTLSIMFSMSYELTIAAIIFFPIPMFGLKMLRKKTINIDKSYYAVIDKGMNFLNDFFANLKSVHIYNGQQTELKRWEKYNMESWNISKKSNVYHDMVLNTISNVIISIMTGIIYGYSLFLILGNKLSIGTLLAFIIIIPKLYDILKSLFTVNIDMSRMKLIMNNLDSIFNLEKTISGNILPNFEAIPRLEFKNVNFSYIEESFGSTINMDLNIAPGSFIGIVGISGAGKTTLFDLIHRHIEPQSGEIYIDNIDIRQYDLYQLRKYIGYNTQKCVLWNQSILENIIYPLGKEDIDAGLMNKFNNIIELANIKDFIETLPEKYNTLITNQGSNLSGGEIQRILLARTFMNNPKVLLLDEYTSALDAITESKLNDTLLKLKGKQTILIIAHRLSTIKNADKIIVIDKGIVAESGTINELLDKKGIFYSMYEHQKL